MEQWDHQLCCIEKLHNQTLPVASLLQVEAVLLFVCLKPKESVCMIRARTLPAEKRKSLEIVTDCPETDDSHNLVDIF